MMRKAGLLLLTAAFALPAAAEGRSQGRLCDAITVKSPDKPRVRDRFSATKTLDLEFSMRLRAPDQDAHMVTLRVLTPQGHLYQEILLSHRPAPGKRGTKLTSRMPLAGTAIATSSLYGRWRVVPYFDDSPRPCSGGSAFTITK